MQHNKMMRFMNGLKEHNQMSAIDWFSCKLTVESDCPHGRLLHIDYGTHRV